MGDQSSIAAVADVSASVQGTIESALTTVGSMTTFLTTLSEVLGTIGRTASCDQANHAVILQGELIAALTASLKAAQTLTGCLTSLDNDGAL